MASMNTSATSASYPSFYRRRTFGRAPSPPTWACYEQIPFDDGYSDSDSDDHSCSEDEEDYRRARAVPDSGSESDRAIEMTNKLHDVHGEDHVQSMDIDAPDDGELAAKKEADSKKDVKGKQRAVDPMIESPKKQHRKKHREPVFNLRPILTIQKSQGFVWNQDLFVPPYIKDRYVASTSPPNSYGFSTSASSTNSALDNYEVEVVEIRVKDGELKDIIP